MNKLSQVELQKILDSHVLWLENKGGERANLNGVNLNDADLASADLGDAYLGGTDLRSANLSHANLLGANLSVSDLCDSDLRFSDLRYANLLGTDLRSADLRGANLDYSVWPLWCGGLHVKTDRRIMAQLAYHFCAQDCDDPDYIKARDAILWFANSFHRANECGELKSLGEDR